MSNEADQPLSERVIVPMSKAQVQAIDDYRYGNRIASRAEAIRLLIEAGLKALGSAGQKTG